MKTQQEKAREKQADFMAETASFFEKLEKHQRKPRKKHPSKYTFYRGTNR